MLRGLGVSMALPWLESLNVWGDVARGATVASEAPVRLALARAAGFARGLRSAVATSSAERVVTISSSR